MYISVYICIIKYICVSGTYLCMGWSSTGLIHDSVVFSRLLFGKTDHSRLRMSSMVPQQGGDFFSLQNSKKENAMVNSFFRPQGDLSLCAVRSQFCFSNMCNCAVTELQKPHQKNF